MADAINRDALSAVLTAAMDAAVLESRGPGVWVLISTAPPWMQRFFDPAPHAGQSVNLPGGLAVLGDFFDDAARHCAAKAQGCLRSGLRMQADRSGAESYFEAAAVGVGERCVLVVKRVDALGRRDATAKARPGDADAGHPLARETGERADAERRVHQLRAQLAHVARVGAMGEMAASLAHELNQPLWAIINYVQAASNLLDGGAEPGRVRDALGKAVEQAERAAAILRGLRSFITESTPQHKTVSINDLIHEVTQLLALELRHARVQLDLALAADLPPVLVDAIQVQQVVFNLIRNAVEAMADSPVTRHRLTVSTRLAPTARVLVEVSDTGPGCSPQVLARILEPFFTTKPGGMGVGLAISKTIVEAHGGHLHAESNASGGLSFRFDLPTQPEET